ncbi:MAG: heparinase II/III-family protein [Candidatus Omnitrophica bacterium]|nr:heparinase II/III-family protein [Candidatus Omnitrophota bacterium]
MKNFDFCIKKSEIVLRQNELRRAISKKVIGQANEILDRPLPDTRYSLFRIYHATGNRTDYQKPFYEKRKNLIILAMASYLTKDKKYLLKLQDYIWDICNEPLWSIPAHLPERINYQHTYIDLLASQTASKLAEILVLLGDKLDENIKLRIKYELEKRIFMPFYKQPQDYWWSRGYHSNWCAVCCGNIGIATLLAGRSGVYFEKIITNTLDAITRYFDNFDSGGGWVEGISYWNYGITHALRYTDTLYRATDGKINLFSHPKVQFAGLFPVHCFLPPNNFVNFGDSFSKPLLNRETMLLLAQHTKTGKQISWLLKYINLRDFEDIIALREIEIPKPEMPEKTFMHFKDIGWVITRKTWKDKNTPVLAVKAGNNGEPHNQIDVGQFIFHVFGEDFFCDHGGGEYTKDYFSPKRYENPFCNAEGHSLIFIDGKGQGIGKEFYGKIIEASHNPLLDIISIDMTSAYPQGLAKKIIRTLKFSKKPKYGVLLLEDLVETDTERIIETRLQYNGELKKLDKSHFVLNGKNGKVAINILKPEKYSVSQGIFKNLATMSGERMDIRFLKIITKSNLAHFMIELQVFS